MLEALRGRARCASRPTIPRAWSCIAGAGKRVLRRPRPQGDARRAVARGYYAALFARCARDDADDPAPAAAGDRARARHRHRGRLPARRRVRPRRRLDDARFATSGVNYGLFCSTPGGRRCRATSRASAAIEMLLTGDFIDAERRRCAWGLVNRVVRSPSSSPPTLALAQRIVAKPRASSPAARPCSIASSRRRSRRPTRPPGGRSRRTCSPTRPGRAWPRSWRSASRAGRSCAPGARVPPCAGTRLAPGGRQGRGRLSQPRQSYILYKS